MKHLPNQITVSRVILIFVFVILANLDSQGEYCIRVSESTAYICHAVACIVALIAGLSDLLDGYLARKYKVESDFGRLIDPLADKIFVLATLTMMVTYRMIPGWFLIIILAREFMVTGLRTMASAKGIVIAADRWGKLKTALQMTMIAIGGASWLHLGGISVESPAINPFWQGLMIVVAAITIFSGLGYFIRNKKLFLESM